jgi:hypothetical protein
MSRSRAKSVLSPRLALFQLAGACGGSLKPMKAALTRGFYVRIRLCGGVGVCRVSWSRPNTRPNTGQGRVGS